MVRPNPFVRMAFAPQVASAMVRPTLLTLLLAAFLYKY
jgi:hypothetical protein